MVLVAGIADCLDEFGIAPGSAAVFGRAAKTVALRGSMVSRFYGDINSHLQQPLRVAVHHLLPIFGA